MKARDFGFRVGYRFDRHRFPVKARMRTTCVLFFNLGFYFDNTNGAAVSSRALLQCLAQSNFKVEVVTGTVVDANPGRKIGDILNELQIPAEAICIAGSGHDEPTPEGQALSIHRAALGGIDVTLLGDALLSHDRIPPEAVGLFPEIFENIIDLVKPDIFLTYGGDSTTQALLGIARRRGVRTVFVLHNFLYRSNAPMSNADVVVTPSLFASNYYLEALGLESTVLPNTVAPDRVTCEYHHGQYLTFVNPSVEKGVFAFARIADELGRRRPDIPILVVEGRGTEETVAGCGLELRDHGTVHFMANTSDPRQFWGVTKVCLLPSLWWENQPLVAIEAMTNGIPVVGSDRGGIPEVLGEAGIVLPLPERITAATRMLPTREEVGPWVAAVIRLWDDGDFYREHRSRAFSEARRWAPDTLGPQYDQFFRDILRGRRPSTPVAEGRSRAIILATFRAKIPWDCERSLQALEREGIPVARCDVAAEGGAGVARSRLASEAIHEGFETIFFIDAKVGFDPRDVLRLAARTEPVLAGIHASEDGLGFDCVFADGTGRVEFGEHVPGFYPLKSASSGFLRVKVSALRKMVESMDLPICDEGRGRGFWPFFQPCVVPIGDRGHAYLDPDGAFSHRLSLIGVTPMADTSIRLIRHGRRPFTQEDVLAAGAKK